MKWAALACAGERCVAADEAGASDGASQLNAGWPDPRSVRLTDDSDRYIAADIRRQVLLESGHACAIPTCQFPATEFAHIDPFAAVKKHEVSNIIALCPNHHTLYDQKKVIDRKAMRAYKLKLQFLNRRYTRYEMRLLTLLAEKPFVLASGEIEVMGLLNDGGLIENAHTFETQSIVMTEGGTGGLP